MPFQKHICIVTIQLSFRLKYYLETVGQYEYIQEKCLLKCEIWSQGCDICVHNRYRLELDIGFFFDGRMFSVSISRDFSITS